MQPAAMQRQHGFTLVELILVIVVLGILAAVVGPRFFDRRVFDERLHYEESLAALRYAQKRAIASGCPVRVQVAASEYSLSFAAACGEGSERVAAGTRLLDPSADRFPAPLSSADLDLTFNHLGCVAAGATNYRECLDQIYAVTLPGSFLLRVHGATGFVETRP